MIYPYVIARNIALWRHSFISITNAKNEFGVFEAYLAAHANDIYHGNQIMNIHLNCLAFQVIIWTITCLEIADIHK